MNDRVFSGFGVTPESSEWLDWKWQYRHRITGVGELAEVISLSEGEKEEISRCLSGFRMAVTPYYASLMDPADPTCPLRMQAVPSVEETRVFPWEKEDPLKEEKYSPTPHVVHRYPDRVLFLVTRQCATYCRHCARKRNVGEEDFVISEGEKEKAIAYIAGTRSIRDVLISGGDPLTMDDGGLEDIVSRLRAISHVEIIRLGTRAPVTLPMRVTPALLVMLKKYQPIWINTQFNHPRELTPQSLKACADIVDAGIPLGNQSVLLKNINDDTETMKELLLKLVKARIRPYYLYQCDLCEGIEHFRTKVETGVEIIRSLTGNISGFAVPEFVIDAPEGGGKIPINPEYIVSIDGEKVVMRNYEGGIYTYPQPREK
ncbi:MAG: KamA family radical SAM protein [Clostridiales bacterium]|nr:KamA family radical SAM protein [Clostridiales bacterium]